jgi:eukaryotic-like serine/threonine-protein kinase
MDSARFRRIEELYHSALEREPEQRDSFLQQACGNDAELRRNVKALLAKDVSTGALVDRSAWAGAGELADRHSAFRPGDALGPYEIVGMLGAGGMGEVYRARDTRLGRQVAIKVCRERFSDRFEREARTISALNHPNICTLYDIGPNYLVMELVEGETLRDRLKRAPGESAPTPREGRMEIARQVLEALRAAHAAGIVHRDLKPANIMIRADGYVKVLDFGLAKRLPAPSEAHGESTETLEISHPGQIAGTIAYMSPEQILGQPAGPRSDLFAFGIILHEMLTGCHPWPRGSAVDMLHAILHDDPPSVSSVGAKSAAIVHKLLRKTPAERYPSADSVLEALGSPSSGEAAIEKSLTTSLTSIAVLPFIFLSDVKERKTLSLGFADALITMLSGLEDFAVLPTSKVMNYVPGADPAQTCSDLAVRYVLQGNVQKIGSRWRVSIQLFDAVAQKMAFAEKHDFELETIFAVQDEIGRRVVESLQTRFPRAATKSEARYSGDPEAYSEFITGLQEGYSIRHETLESAVQHLSAAVDRDPEFALAHAWLAYVSMNIYFSFDPTPARVEAAEQHYQMALAIDPTLPEANLAKAFILWSPAKNFQHAEAIAALGKVLEARPNLEQAHNRMASICLHIGRFAEGRVAYKQAQRANPKNVQIPVRQLALLSLWSGDFAQAERAGETWIRESPGDPQALWDHPQPALMIGDLDAAEGRLASSLKLRPNDPLLISLQGMLHARRGEARSAVECANRTLGFPQANGHFHHAYYQVACIYAVLGETENAMGWLERSADTGFPCWPFFKVDPHLEKLREKPAFKKLVSDLERKWTSLKIERV